eukprot:GHVT01070447.1.p1 GENE.GHVT01070447.1~~GHVT01070447.1.p1  ORF type:complete len:139 (-),score=25.18 GHVT01070447.1:574-990(-)
MGALPGEPRASSPDGSQFEAPPRPSQAAVQRTRRRHTSLSPVPWKTAEGPAGAHPLGQAAPRQEADQPEHGKTNYAEFAVNSLEGKQDHAHQQQGHNSLKSIESRSRPILPHQGLPIRGSFASLRSSSPVTRTPRPAL